MKKKLVTGALLCAFGAVAVTGGTLAYFTDTDDADNTFTMGNVDIVLDEAAVSRDGDEWVAGNDRVQSNKYEAIYPGAVLPKDPTIHNEGDYGAFVRAKVTVVNGMTLLPLYAENDTLSDNLYNDAFKAMVGNQLGAGWELTDGITAAEAMEAVMNGDTDATFVFTYNSELGAEKDTTPIFQNIVIPADLTQDDARLVSIQKTGFEVNVVAEAIQADGFENVTEAFAAFDAE